MTEIASLRQEVSEYRELDPRYKAALKLINDDRGFEFLAQRIRNKLEKTVLLMLNAKTFDDFVANAGLKLKVDDTFQITLESMALHEAIIFAVASREDQEKKIQPNYHWKGTERLFSIQRPTCILIGHFMLLNRAQNNSQYVGIGHNRKRPHAILGQIGNENGWWASCPPVTLEAFANSGLTASQDRQIIAG